MPCTWRTPAPSAARTPAGESSAASAAAGSASSRSAGEREAGRVRLAVLDVPGGDDEVDAVELQGQRLDQRPVHPVRSGRGDDRDRCAAGAGRLDQLPGTRHGARRLVRHVLEHLGEHGLGVEPVPGAGLGREDVDRPASGEDGEVGELPALVGEERLVAAPVQRLGVDQRPVEVEQQRGDPRRRPRHAVAKSTSPAATDPPTASLATDPFGASISTTGTIGETS